MFDRADTVDHRSEAVPEYSQDLLVINCRRQRAHGGRQTDRRVRGKHRSKAKCRIEGIGITLPGAWLNVLGSARLRRSLGSGLSRGCQLGGLRFQTVWRGSDSCRNRSRGRGCEDSKRREDKRRAQKCKEKKYSERDLRGFSIPQEQSFHKEMGYLRLDCSSSDFHSLMDVPATQLGLAISRAQPKVFGNQDRARTDKLTIKGAQCEPL